MDKAFVEERVFDTQKWELKDELEHQTKLFKMADDDAKGRVWLIIFCYNGICRNTFPLEREAIMLHLLRGPLH